jgi:hypothetical protein
VVVSSIEDTLSGHFFDGGEEFGFGFVDVVESHELGVFDDGEDIFHQLLALAALVVVSVCDNDGVFRHGVGDLESELLRLVLLLGDVVVLDVSPFEEMYQRQSDSGLTTA